MPLPWLASLLICALSSSVLSDCPVGTTTNTQERCVHVETTRLNWKDAEAFCVSRGGHLTSLHNAFDASLMSELAKSTDCKYYYTGGVCNNYKCTWTDGTPFTYYNWAKGYPHADLSYISIGFFDNIWKTVSGDDGECFVCESPQGKSDCKDWKTAGYTDSGIYEISVGGASHSVYCDMVTDGGGWTVIQRREDGSESFWDHSWADYKNGFGTNPGPGHNFWAGNELIHQLTAKNSNVSLRIEMHDDGTPGSDFANAFWWNNYYNFKVGSESDEYPLNVWLDWNNIQGNASSAWYDITYSSGSKFSTVDRINDPQKDCVTKYQMGGWWLYNCALSSLNGAYTPIDWSNGYGLFWIVNGGDTVIHPRKTLMMLRSV